MEYDSLLITRSPDVEVTKQALGIVERFIIEHDRVLYGGMSIDFYMRIHGQALYADYVLPDYDFYSPDYLTDAYTIAMQLYEAGIDGIDVIQAKHWTTVRVRVNGVVVADVSHSPREHYEKKVRATAIRYKEFFIINEVHMLCNLISTLSVFVITTPPNEPYFRFNKDYKRYMMVNEIARKAFTVASIKKTATLHHSPQADVLYTGEAGALLIIKAYLVFIERLTKRLAKDGKDAIVSQESAMIYEQSVSGAELLLMDKPTVCVFKEPHVADQSASTIKIHQAVFETVPRAYETDDLITYVYDMTPLFINGFKSFEGSDSWPFAKGIKVCSITTVMYHLLVKSEAAATVATANYSLSLYFALSDIISHVSEIIEDFHIDEPRSASLYKDMVKQLPFFINGNVAGTHNYSIYDLLYADKVNNLLYGTELKYHRVRRFTPEQMLKLANGGNNDRSGNDHDRKFSITEVVTKAVALVADDPLFVNYIKESE
jgi:hypothetical protein